MTSSLSITTTNDNPRRRLQDLIPDGTSSMTAQIVFYCILSLFVLCIAAVIWWMVQKWRSQQLDRHQDNAHRLDLGTMATMATTEPSVFSKSSILTQIKSLNASHPALAVSSPPMTMDLDPDRPFSFSPTAGSRPPPMPRRPSQSESQSLQCSMSRNGHSIFKVSHDIKFSKKKQSEPPSLKTIFAKKICILYYQQFPSLKCHFRGCQIKKVLIRRRLIRKLKALRGHKAQKTFFKNDENLESDKLGDDDMASELRELTPSQRKVIHALNLMEDRFKSREQELYHHVATKYKLPMLEVYRGRNAHSVYQRRVIDLYRSKYPELKHWKMTEILDIFEREKLIQKLKDLGPARILTAEEQKLIHALELLDTHYNCKEHALYHYLCDKYNVVADEVTEDEHRGNKGSLSNWSFNPTNTINFDDRYQTERDLPIDQYGGAQCEYDGVVSPMERDDAPQSVANVYRQRVITLYQRQYPSLTAFVSNEMNHVLESRKLRKMLKDPDTLMFAVGLERALSDKEKKLIHALELLQDRYRGKEHGLYLFLCQKYGVIPDREYTDDVDSVSRFGMPRHVSSKRVMWPKETPFTPPSMNIHSLALIAEHPYALNVDPPEDVVD